MTTVREHANRTIHLAGLCGTDRGDTAIFLALLGAGIAWKEIEQQLDYVSAFLTTMDRLSRARLEDSRWTPAVAAVEEQIEIERRRHGPTRGLKRLREKLQKHRINEALRGAA